VLGGLAHASREEAAIGCPVTGSGVLHSGGKEVVSKDPRSHRHTAAQPSVGPYGVVSVGLEGALIIVYAAVVSRIETGRVATVCSVVGCGETDSRIAVIISLPSLGG
jgi:hypothetical protein